MIQYHITHFELLVCPDFAHFAYFKFAIFSGYAIYGKPIVKKATLKVIFTTDVRIVCVFNPHSCFFDVVMIVYCGRSFHISVSNLLYQTVSSLYGCCVMAAYFSS